MKREISLRALAKINLDLRVLHQRPDGYHEVRTVFQTISLADRIRASYEPSDATSIEIDGNVEIADNLIARATRLVASELQCGGTFRFRLTKRIPMGAGLGGGSSDAAATLLALPALMGREIGPERLAQLAAELGSDVPFFLYGGTAVGLGRGEELYPLADFPPSLGLLVTPEIAVSTREAYGALTNRIARESGKEKLAAFARFAWTEDLTQARNDFEEPVFDLNPQLRTIREVLSKAGALCARMTGSGSAIFGLFQKDQDVTRAQKALHAHRIIPFRLVNRKRYRALWKKQTTYPSQSEQPA